MRVCLDPTDTYTLEAHDWTGTGPVVERYKVTGLYADQLGAAFEAATGLRTSLGDATPPAKPLPTELTPAGEQYIVPGCERAKVCGPKKPRQGTLWD